MLQIGSRVDEEDIVLDFFAGSAPTAHAVMSQNASDGGNRRFVLVQMHEPLPKPEPEMRSIFEMGAQRIRAVGREFKAGGGTLEATDPLDCGFRVFKLDSSNIRAWEPDRENFDQTLLDALEHLERDRTETDILYELLLKLGLDLCVPIEKREIATKEVHSIGGGVLFACLAETITREDVELLAQGIVQWHSDLAPAVDTTCVFRDSAFADDVTKTNLAAILEQHGIKKVRSL